jgi:beta-lactamase superfamily II metal-dependent hydrolase
MIPGSPSLKHVDFWDVGQGDCTVLNFTDNTVILIDTGGQRSPVVDWLANVRPTIRSVILTHIDADHAGCALLHSRRTQQ